MIGEIDSEYKRLKYSSIGVIFELAFLLLDEEYFELYIFKWNLKYNMYKHDTKRWPATLNFINRNGFCNKIIRPFNENGYEIEVQEEIREICSFFGVRAVHVKANMLTDKVLIEKCDKNIPLFNLEDFNCAKYPHSVHDPEDEVRYFAQ